VSERAYPTHFDSYHPEAESKDLLSFAALSLARITTAARRRDEVSPARKRRVRSGYDESRKAATLYGVTRLTDSRAGEKYPVRHG
jgi:hypothetical protein